MTNLFSTRQLIRFREPIQVDRILYARFAMVLTGIFTFISAGLLISLLAIPDGSGWIYYILFSGLLIVREFLKRRYSKYILSSSDESPFVEIMDLLKLRDKFSISLVEQTSMWVGTMLFASYNANVALIPVLLMLAITGLRILYQYRKLVKANA
jgi:hypothetical protein